MITGTAIKRLKSQLLTSGVRQRDQALFQVIDQLIDAVSQSVTDASAPSSGGGGGSVDPAGPAGAIGLMGPPGMDLISEMENYAGPMAPGLPTSFYDTGTWLPDIGGDPGYAGQVYDVRAGWYVRIGRLVYVGFNIRYSNKGVTVGATVIENLPFIISPTVSVESSYCTMGWGNTVPAYVGVSGFALAGTRHIILFGQTAAATGSFTTPIGPLDLSNTTHFAGTCCYRTDG